MPRCAFLSTDNLEDFFVYDDLVKPFLRRLGWAVEDVSWRNKYIDYNQFELVVVRSTWDYQDDADAFLACLRRIEQSNAVLENAYDLMHWNISKSYLQDLSNKGVQTLPTLWPERFSLTEVEDAFNHFNTEKLIIKPLVSANADHTYLFTKTELGKIATRLEQTFSDRAFMIQAFEKSVKTQGEYSLFYFGNAFSHGICKMPAQDDFRVQEEHGGQLTSLVPTEPMLALAEQTIQALPAPALYARIDMLNTERGLEIIEVELIEPSLYFNMDEDSASRFAQVIHQKYA
ncbi:RimK family alpha-L-glutamate ligase [Glaciecola siphonariae]|uniref:RimK family alpha-L-glutamate ligase n=1 Tax=Glaciecola siphonariae TaxID=521012 RepID=A0ABV9LX26_9ALTE